ncbi:MAG: GNAT family N-acetyltransferase [Chitinophagaceae bacterium]|nr:GNAT family N-acetyltransferase [Chitinophagaceae bacterium]
MLRIQKISPDSAALETVRQLFLEYADELQENLCFQSFDAEVKDPLKKYGPPEGALFIAYWNEAPAGCIALQPLKEEGVCEMKRLYVKPKFRKYGIGRSLVEQLITESYQLGYTDMRLDTLERLKPAISLYKSLGFEKTQAYNENPLSGVVYIEKKIQ